MGCTGSKAASNRVVPIVANPDDGLPACAATGKAAWGDVPAKNRADMTDEERSNNTTPPRTADVERSPVDGGDEPRTPEDVTQVEPVNLDNVLAEAAALFPAAPKDSAGRPLEHLKDHSAQQESARSPMPAKQEVADTTTRASPRAAAEQGAGSVDSIPLPKAQGHEAAIPHWERQEPLPTRPGTSSRRPESSSGRLVVYKTAAQKKAEEAARRKRLEAETGAAAAGLVPRPGTASRGMSALPPLEERRRNKAPAAPTPVALTAAPGADVAVVGEVNEVKGGASWQLDAGEFVECSSPVKRAAGRPPAARKADVFSLDDDDEEEAEALDDDAC